MKYNGVIESKLRIIEEKLEEIDSWNVISIENLRSNSMLRNAVERALQVAIEAVIDVCERILALEEAAAESTSADTIKQVINRKIISDTPNYIEMVRFRNFIVHRYERIDIDIVYLVLTTKLSTLKQFVHEIRAT